MYINIPKSINTEVIIANHDETDSSINITNVIYLLF